MIFFTLHYFCFLPVIDKENELEVNTFVPETEEDMVILSKIKSSFRLWQKKRGTKKKTETVRSILMKVIKFGGNILMLYILTIIIGPLIGQAKNIAIYFKEYFF